MKEEKKGILKKAGKSALLFLFKLQISTFEQQRWKDLNFMANRLVLFVDATHAFTQCVKKVATNERTKVTLTRGSVC